MLLGGFLENNRLLGVYGEMRLFREVALLDGRIYLGIYDVFAGGELRSQGGMLVIVSKQASHVFVICDDFVGIVSDHHDGRSSVPVLDIVNTVLKRKQHVLV